MTERKKNDKFIFKVYKTVSFSFFFSFLIYEIFLTLKLCFKFQLTLKKKTACDIFPSFS